MLRLLFITLWLVSHPVHVSLLSIDYVPDKEMFNVFLRIYFDDFLLDSGISADDQKKMNFSESNQFTSEILGNYINDRITIIINDRQTSAQIRNMDLSDNELRVNLVLPSEKKVNSVTVRNLIMTSLYNDQVNMTIVRVNSFEEGVKLTAGETEKTFKIN